MTPTNRLPAIEALGEALAALQGDREKFRAEADFLAERHFVGAGLELLDSYTRDAERLQEHLANSGWTLTPGPTVNAGEEVA